MKLMLNAGENCEQLLAARIRNVKVKDVQADEIWTFCEKKEGHKFPHEANEPGIGDAYTFIALERRTKLILACPPKMNLQSALALHFAFYNFCRIHGKLRVTPAMEAGIADHVWTIEELIGA